MSPSQNRSTFLPSLPSSTSTHTSILMRAPSFRRWEGIHCFCVSWKVCSSFLWLQKQKTGWHCNHHEARANRVHRLQLHTHFAYRHVWPRKHCSGVHHFQGVDKVFLFRFCTWTLIEVWLVEQIYERWHVDRWRSETHSESCWLRNWRRRNPWWDLRDV